MKNEILQDLAWVEGYLDACSQQEEEFVSQCVKDRVIRIQEDIEKLRDCSEPNEVLPRQFKIISELGYVQGSINAEYHLYLSDEHKNNLSNCLNKVHKELIQSWGKV